MIAEKHLLADIEGLKKSPWFNASYISDERRLGIREALDMISSIIRNRGGEMDGEKVAKQLEKDVAAYRAGFADGYRVAKAEAPEVDAIPVEFIEYEKQRLNPVIAVEVKHGDTKEAERLTAIVAVMDAIISNWRYTTGPDWRAERKEE